MDLDRDILGMIDEYVADALGATNTRKAKPVAVAPSPPKAALEIEVDIDVSDMEAAADEPAEDELIPVEVDDRTDPEGRNVFSFDEHTAWMTPAFQSPRDPIPTLSRVRTARGSQPPPAEIEIDDEITNVLEIPAPSK
jgi:hypothetical protein